MPQKIHRIEQFDDVILFNAEDAPFVLEAYFLYAVVTNAFDEALDLFELDFEKFHQLRNRGKGAIRKAVTKILQCSAEQRHQIINVILIDVAYNHSFFDFFTEVTAAKKALGQFKVSKLRPDMFTELFDALLADKVSYHSRYQLKIDLNSALKRVSKHLVDRNGTSIPYKLFLQDVEVTAPISKPREFWDQDSITTVIFNQKLRVFDRAVIAFIFFTMCRPSEMWALRWADVDLKKGQCNISKRVVRAESGFVDKDGTKRRDEVFRAYLAKDLIPLLKALQNTHEGEWVFPREDGSQMNNDHFYQVVWPKLRERVGLPSGPRYYSLKHLGNSYLGDNGVDAGIRGELMGHADDRMARATYRTVADSRRIAAVGVFDRLSTGSHGD